MKITKIHIEKFRGFQNEDFELGSQLTAIAGQNGTQKSTLLGIVTQTFTLKFDDPMRTENLCVEVVTFLLLKINSDYHQLLISPKGMNGLFPLILG